MNVLIKNKIARLPQKRGRFLAGGLVIMLTLMLIWLFAWVTFGYAAAFPGQNGKLVMSVDPTGAWNLDTWEIYTMNDNGKNLKRLTNNTEFDYYPAWSPDGKQIAFSRRDQAGNYDIYVMKANGKQETRLANTPDVDEIAPAWSPDGSKLAVSVYPNGNFDFFASSWNEMEIHVMNADGSGPATPLTGNEFEDYGATWSPDGQKIAFSTNRDGNYEIYMINVDGSGAPVNLTNWPEADDGWWAPYWSPDGQKIAFVSTRDGNCEIYAIDANGDPSTLTRLTNTGEEETDGMPVWSPDGRWIAFKKVDQTDSGNVYVMDAVEGDTGQLNQLTDTGEMQIRTFDWQSLGN